MVTGERWVLLYIHHSYIGESLPEMPLSSPGCRGQSGGFIPSSFQHSGEVAWIWTRAVLAPLGVASAFSCFFFLHQGSFLQVMALL